MSLDEIVMRASNVYEKTVSDVPQLRRGIVWCVTCGSSQRVDSANALRHGWPTCCGQTMTIDSPEERATRNNSDTATLRASNDDQEQ